MADVCLQMASGGDSPAKCREASRRRIEMRLFTVFAGDLQSEPGSSSRGQKRPGSPHLRGGGKLFRTSESQASPPPLPSPSPSSSSSSSSSSTGGGADGPEIPSTAAQVTVVEPPPPPFGTVSLSGRTREMEDAVSLRPGFFNLGVSDALPLHLFAVFDGHGGSHVSALCKERLHLFLAGELGRWWEANKGGASSSSSSSDQMGGEISEEGWTAVMGRCFQRMDELALTACACGHVGEPPCGCERAGLTSEIVGSTAVVAVLSRNRIVVANCGDSRAVLSRGGRAVPLSSDHKPDRPDELARIEAAGGRVIYLNGARVLGILAMSRALGDKYLKPVVISEPEISITERTPQDECLIIASDGLWDVLSNDLACDIARRCLQEGSQPTGVEDLNRVAADQVMEDNTSQRRCTLAAALLTRLALGRKSNDNISVIVIDLRRG